MKANLAAEELIGISKPRDLREVLGSPTSCTLIGDRVPCLYYQQVGLMLMLDRGGAVYSVVLIPIDDPNCPRVLGIAAKTTLVECVQIIGAAASQESRPSAILAKWEHSGYILVGEFLEDGIASSLSVMRGETLRAVES